MKKLSILLISFALLLGSCVDEESNTIYGKVIINTNNAGALVFVDDELKTMIDDDGKAQMTLSKGEYEIKINKKKPRWRMDLSTS